MTNHICVKSKRCLVFFFLAALPITGGCMGGRMEVNVVVLNYNSQPISNISVANQSVAGYFDSYRPGRPGGSMYCCIEISSGATEVQWTYGGVKGSDKAGEQDKAIGIVPALSRDAPILGVHIYPDSVVEFTLTHNLPHEKKQGD